MIDPFPMITAANTLEASPKPSYGPHKANERYLDDEDVSLTTPLRELITDASLSRLNHIENEPVAVSDFLQALETLRTHLRKKYYGG